MQRRRELPSEESAGKPAELCPLSGRGNVTET